MTVLILKLTEEDVAFTSDTFKAFQEIFLGIRYLIIDEKSMVGLDMLFWVEQRFLCLKDDSVLVELLHVATEKGPLLALEVDGVALLYLLVRQSRAHAFDDNAGGGGASGRGPTGGATGGGTGGGGR
ncbi:hypothetical protein N7519_004412 [Penicillium mononematosum]|uniref:uncharacterized protein n=1 Tax=Penicillium mononematosum TaxID=268346 RepID=UPI002548D2F7|nr:uncharacterized protein N7519_004412 [Penicillium mononematosum]KAJ6189504.1 hypothetical protein N7519_004412 [Penicillium mononematosum]